MKNPGPEISPEERLATDAELCGRVADGDEAAAEEFYDKYHRLAFYFGRKAINSCRDGTVDVSDLGHDMFIYMLERAGKYDSVRGASFSSYVSLYASHRAEESLDAIQYSVRLPDAIRDIVRKVRRIDSQRAGQRRPFMSDEEISEQFGVALHSDVNRVSVADIRRAIMLTAQMGSIDSGYSSHDIHTVDHPYSLDEKSRLALVGADVPRSVEDEVMETALKDDIEKVLDTLGERQAQVLRLRFGIGQDREWTLEEVGNLMGVTGARIGQIEARALEKLQMPKIRRYLAPYR